MNADAHTPLDVGTAIAVGRVSVKRLLVVGLGSIGRRHARVARCVRPGLEVAAWRHRATAEPLPTDVASVVWSLDDALAFRPDAAVIASPASHHIEAARALAEAGVHLLVEKPIAAHPDGVEELIAECARRNLVLMTGYNLRFLPSLQRLRALINAGVIGTVLSVRAEAGQYLPSWRPDTDYRTSVSAQAALGGGVLLELSHEFDYLRWLFGEVAWVQARVSRQSALEIDVEDTAHVVIGFVASPVGSKVVASVSLDLIRHDATRSCTVIGADGTLRWTAQSGVVEVFHAGAAGWEQLSADPVDRDASYFAEWVSFLSCIEQRAPIAVTGVDGLAALKLVDAARQSASTARVVMLARDGTAQ